jgi:hypothetical protein
MAYRIAITYTQESDDAVDHRTLTEDFSSDPLVHNIKQEIFTEELTEALNRISKRLVAAARTAIEGNKPGNPGGKP